ncbi:MAG: hypothetical protein ABI467_22310, partial [Kofleriaceae bacterium]
MRIAMWIVVLAACGSAPKAGDDTTTSDATPASDGAVTSDAPPMAATCGLRTGMRGKTNRTITVGTLSRTFIVYLPAGVSPT